MLSLLLPLPFPALQRRLLVFHPLSSVLTEHFSRTRGCFWRGSERSPANRPAGLHCLQLPLIVGAEDRDFRALAPLEVPQPVLIVEPQLPVRVHHGLVEAQARGAAAPVAVHLSPIEVGVARVEHPALRGVKRDPGVTRGMAWQGDHEDFRREPVEGPDAVEAEPGFAAAGVGAPVPHAVPLHGAVAAPGNEALALPFRRLALRFHDMDARLREVLDAAGVVEIQVSEKDVAHVSGRIAERLDLMQRRILYPEAD